jgi:hypothetical protein
MDWLRRLESLNACTDAMTWARTQPDAKTAWTTCQDGRWMLWISSRLGLRLRLVASAACKCARLPLRYVPPGEDRPLKAIETTERWTRGEATIEEVREARENIVYADPSYAADAAAAAASTAADAADPYAVSEAATDASNIADDAAEAAAFNVVDDADDIADDDTDTAYNARQKAKENTLAQCADLVRETIPWEIIEKLIS